MSNDNVKTPEQEQLGLTAEEISEQRQIRRDKLQELREMGRDPFVQETYNVTAHSKDIKDNYDALEDQEVAIAGRIMSKRIMGKAAFFEDRKSVV